MKKTLLAAALAVGFAGAGVAQAETSVTLYGVIGTGIHYDQIKGANGFKAKRFGLNDGGNDYGDLGNRWGLRGVEDLGNGLRVVFNVEAGFNSLTGDSAQGGKLFGRRATVGLHSDSWGSIDVGRQTNVASNYLIGMIDPFGGGHGTANGGATFTSGNTVRWDNTIMYQTPNFNGFQAALGYSFNTGGEQQPKFSGVKDNNNRGITAGVKYENGPLQVALTYDQISNSAGKAIPGAENKTVHEWALGAAYDFEVVKVSAAFGQARNGKISAFSDYETGFLNETAGLRRGRVNNYLLGLSAPVGGGKILASYGVSDPNRRWDQDSDFRKKQHTYALGYTYPLSKRTNVYAYAAQQKNVEHVRKLKQTTFATGLTHRF